MAKRRKTKTVSKTVSAELFAEVAEKAVPMHQHWIAEGYQLKGSSRLWQRQDGTWTGRFIYQPPKTDAARVQMIITVRGMRFA